MRYFYKPATGINADLKRHAEAETRLLRQIADAEASGDHHFASTYKSFLALLRQSKAEIAAKLGKS